MPPPTIHHWPAGVSSPASTGGSRKSVLPGARRMAASHTATTATSTTKATASIPHHTMAIARAEGPAGSSADKGPLQALSIHGAKQGRMNACQRQRPIPSSAERPLRAIPCIR